MTLTAAISCAATLLGLTMAPPQVQEHSRVDTAGVDVFVIDAVPSQRVCERALRAAGLPSGLVCDAVTGRFGDDILVIMPSSASDRVKLTEALRVMSLYVRQPIPTRRIYALARKGCSWQNQTHGRMNPPLPTFSPPSLQLLVNLVPSVSDIGERPSGSHHEAADIESVGRPATLRSR
jgi:hypothetical protein